MTAAAPSPHPVTATDGLGLDRGAHLLVKRALRDVAAGERVQVVGTHPALAPHLAAWCRAAGHRFVDDGERLWVVKGSAVAATEEAGDPDAPADEALPSWGLAARGARVEQGGPDLHFPLARGDDVWADEAPGIYAQAAASQWDPATAIPWDDPSARELDPDVEAAVVQVMTYLVENENAALLVPARFLAQVHPHFREVLGVLAVQVADEARHVEVFTRRALLNGGRPGLSTTGGQTSLQTLVEEPDFALASFLLSVLGEGTFLSLLRFLEDHAPDAVTGAVARLAGEDEARHVAFGVAHLRRSAERDPALRTRLANAVERRHDALAHTAGLNEEVFDALVVLAAGAMTPDAIGRGWDAVQRLQADMDAGRRRRLARLGFDEDEAAHLSALHTRNFM